MDKKATIALEHSSLTVVRTDKKEKSAKLLTLKQTAVKSHILLPPQEEKYIKAKKHDFF